MSNPAHTLASLLAPYMDPAYAALGGVLGLAMGMILIAAGGTAVALWMEKK